MKIICALPLTRNGGCTTPEALKECLERSPDLRPCGARGDFWVDKTLCQKCEHCEQVIIEGKKSPCGQQGQNNLTKKVKEV